MEELRVGFLFRLFAVVIDAVIAGVAAGVAFLVLWSFLSVPPRLEERLFQGLFFCAFAAIMLSEFFFARTIGKAILGISVARYDAAPADDAALLFRWMLKSWPALLLLVDAIEPNGLIETFGKLGIAGVAISFLASFNQNKQSWYDYLTATAVYRTSDIVRDEE